MTDLRLQLARDLRAICELHAHLADEAAHRAASKDLPGGDALVMLGPAANLETWAWQIDQAETAYFAGATDQWLEVYDQDNDPPPVLLVLAYWEDKVRDERNQPTDLRATVRRSADYLLGQLDLRSTEYLGVEELATDLRNLRTRLESVLHDGIRLDRGVPCMNCGTLLVKIWGQATDGTDDRWHCSTCETWSNVEQYKLAVKYAARAHAKGLTATDMEDEYRVPAGTIRVWAHRGLVKKRGRDASGRQLYDVADTLATRDRDIEDARDVV
jgi:hypothetical protein